MSSSTIISNYHNEYHRYANQSNIQLTEAKLVAKTQGKGEFKDQVTNLLETLHDGHISLNLQEQLDSCKKIFEEIKAHQKPSCFPWIDRIISYFTFERPVQEMMSKIAAYIPAHVEMQVVVHTPIKKAPATPVDKRTVGQIAYDELRSQIMKTRDSELFADIMNMPTPPQKEIESTKTGNVFSSMASKFTSVFN